MSSRLVTFFDSATRTIAIALIVALVATAGLWYALQRGTQRTVTAYFASTVGLYTQNTVDVQGIPVGTVDEIVPQGQVVRVTLSVDNDVPVPADTQAVIIAPTLVSDRYVQLGGSVGGPELQDGAVIPISRTAVPVELDAVYKSLDTISSALGPNGVNSAGALNQLLRSSAGALGGNGEALKSTIQQVAGAVGTLSDNRGNLFATVDNLGQFTNTLARNDGNVRALNLQLADISAFLSAERGNLSEVLRVLPPALADVARFIRDNRDILRTDVGQLAQITDILVRQRAALTELSDVAPLGLSNLFNVYNARSGTLDVRTILAPNLGLNFDPRLLLCGLLTGGQGGGVLGSGQVGGQTPGGGLLAGAGVLCGALFNPGALTNALAPFLALQQALGTLTPGQAAVNLPPAANITSPVTANAIPTPGGLTDSPLANALGVK